MIPTKSSTAFVPISANEIIEDIHKATEIGITMVHIHARNESNGEPSWKAEDYERIILGIRSFSKDLIICTSLSGRDASLFEHRSNVLELDGNAKPDMGSLTLSSLNFNQSASINSPSMIQNLAIKMNQKGILPELEAFDSGMINYAHYLVKKGLLHPPHYFNLIAGNIACAQADLLHVGIMVRDLPNNSYWSLAGIGDQQLPMNMLGIASNSGVRVGLEDNIWFDSNRSKLATNYDLLARTHSIISASGQKYITATEMRNKLNLLPGNGQYGRPLD
jgi:uncharacterized protein (DUF849 family)